MFRSIARSTPLLILAALAGGLVLAFWFGSATFRVAGTVVEAKVYPVKTGITAVKVPPIGEIKARTHRTPVGISLSLEKVGFSQVKRLADTNISSQELLAKAEADIIDSVRRLVIRLLLLGAVGGLFAGLLLPARNAKRVAAALCVGVIAVALPVAAVVREYNIKAWRQPQYSGMLAAAPWLIDTAEDKLQEFDLFRGEMRRVAANLYAFYTKVENWKPVDLGNDRLKVLHVGDIHNNPVAFDIIHRIVRDFDVDMVVDTGDMTDFGTPIEAGIAEKVGALDVPYVFIPGNHDSPSVLEALKEQENVLVVENDVITVRGLRIFGLSEPASEAFSAVPSEAEHLNELSREAARQYEEMKRAPDIVAAHSIRQAVALVGRSPVILVGHTHTPALDTREGSVVADVGTSGAAGIRNFQVDEDLPYSFKLLHFDKRSRALLAADSLALSGASRDFVLERRLIDGGEERLPKRAASAKLDLSWKADP